MSATPSARRRRPTPATSRGGPAPLAAPAALAAPARRRAGVVDRRARRRLAARRGRRAGARRLRHRPRAARAAGRRRRAARRWPSGAYLVAALLGGVLTAATVRASARVSQTILLDLRRRVFRHTQRLSLEFHEQLHVGAHHLAADVRPRRAARAARRRRDHARVERAGDGAHRGRRSCCSTGAAGCVLLVAVVPGRPAHPLVPGPLAGAVPQARAPRRRGSIVRFVETMTGIRAVQAFRREPQVARASTTSSPRTYRGTNAEAIRLNGVVRHRADR